MAISPPRGDDLARIAGEYGFALSPGDLESFRGPVTGALGSYDVVQRLYEARLPEPPDRQYTRPADADNELGAWCVTSAISGSGSGPLAGRRVAVKDNIAVAGLPMMNGSATVEGYVPRRDATVPLDVSGRHFADDMCLRIASGYEAAVGGFPLPPGY